MDALLSYLPSEAREHEDEHELKLRIEPRAPIGRRVERIERLAAQEDGAARDALAADLGEAFGLDGPEIEAISHIDRFSVYCDTRALDLYRLGASLRTRLRRNGRCRVNAKRHDGGERADGYVVRKEWRYHLEPELFDFVKRMRFRPLAEHHFGDLLEPAEARRCLSPVVQIHKTSTRIELTSAWGQQLLVSLDRFRGFDCRQGQISACTPELRELEIEARNGKAARALESLRDSLCRMTGVATAGPKYQVLVEALALERRPTLRAVHSSIGSSRWRS